MHPVLVANSAYRRAIVRLCTEQIREIEGRLEQGCGTRFEQQLQNCEDLGAVARLLIVLQRRTELKGAESGWLEELAVLPPAELDERAIEMTRLLKRRIAELQAAVPCAVEPEQLVGASVLRRFEGHGAFSGTVVEHDPCTGFRVQYSDGDSEDLPLRELRSMLLREGLQAPQRHGAARRAARTARRRRENTGCASVVRVKARASGRECEPRSARTRACEQRASSRC